MSDTAVAERQVNPVAVFRQQVESRQQEFAAALPAHIPPERFVRVILTAVNKTPALLHADRASLFSSAMMSAADGLLCDGREAALVIYRTKKKDREGHDIWVDAVQYMPMVAGILKKVRNSGELSSIVARVVYAGDKFRNWIDNDGEHLEYEAGEAQARDIVRCVFAMAKMKDGSIVVEVLQPADVEKIRQVSRAKDKGPWVDWWEEMAKKSAIRRLSKRLPLNTDLDDLVRRDDALYDFDGAREEAAANQPRGLAGKLDALAALPSVHQRFDAETGEVIENESASSQQPDQLDAAAAGHPSGHAAGHQPAARSDSPADNFTSSPQQEGVSSASATGQAASEPSAPSQGSKKAPGAAAASANGAPTEAEYVAHAEAWIARLTDIEEGEAKWSAEKSARNKHNVSEEQRLRLKALLDAKCAEIADADLD